MHGPRPRPRAPRLVVLRRRADQRADSCRVGRAPPPPAARDTRTPGSRGPVPLGGIGAMCLRRRRFALPDTGWAQEQRWHALHRGATVWGVLWRIGSRSMPSRQSQAALVRKRMLTQPRSSGGGRQSTRLMCIATALMRRGAPWVLSMRDAANPANAAGARATDQDRTQRWRATSRPDVSSLLRPAQRQDLAAQPRRRVSVTRRLPTAA